MAKKANSTTTVVEKTIDPATEDSTESFEEVVEETAGDETVSQDTTKESVEEIPEKFKGKSAVDIAKSYEELERKLGSQANELGELRKWSREFVRADLEAKKPNKETESVSISEDDFNADPFKATQKMLDSRLDRIEKALMQTNSSVAEKEFASKHPDYIDVGSSPEFQEWVMKSPYRINMFQRADSRDFSAADELLSMYKDHADTQKGIAEGASATAKEETKSKMKRMSGESESAAVTTRKIYKSADLIRLKINDPAKYDAMQPEIMKAYTEGRVK